MTAKPSEPDVYRYLDYRAFLRDWFQWKKEMNPRYSHRLFARKAGQRSPSLLLNVMEGRRNLTTLTAAAFGKAVGFGVRKQRFFELLVELDQAERPIDRQQAMDGILATTRFQQARRVDERLFRVFGEWHYGAICELARCEGFQSDPAWIAKTLRPTIAVKSAAEALDTLLELGLLRRSDTGEITASDEWVMPDGPQDVAILNAHTATLTRAKDAIGEFSGAERVALAFTGSMPKDALPELRDKIQTMFNEIAAACEKDPRQVVYQMNFVLYPLSDPGGTST